MWIKAVDNTSYKVKERSDVNIQIIGKNSLTVLKFCTKSSPLRTVLVTAVDRLVEMVFNAKIICTNIRTVTNV